MMSNFILGAEGASIYSKSDARYKFYHSKINPIIEQELNNHKIINEKYFAESELNKNYVFLRAPSKIKKPQHKS